ncbi:MAG: ATP-binding cassette domain-containing protein, partial [Solirubrobacterales bacterium]|nr:ATP-binding cassette domain-containing protein [Solirubrobacterales bacterium]
MPAVFQLERVRVRGAAAPRLQVDTLSLLRGTTAVLGPSGSGKTTLLDLLVGFAQPDAGTLRFDAPPGGDPPLAWSPAQGGTWPHLTVRAHLTAVAPAPDEVGALLATFDLSDVAERRPAQLSLGQLARLGVARALATRARVLVLDEPTAGVDVE